MTERYKQALTIIEALAARWPRCFFMFEGRRQPLKIGIYDEVRTALGDTVDSRDLGFALKIYCTSARYRSRLVAGATRIDLDGEAAGIVTAEEVPPKAPTASPSPKAPARAKSPLKVLPAASPPSSTNMAPAPKGLSLADLRAAALARRGQ